MTSIYLALDFFHYRWEHEDGSLWACFRPHVRRADLATWIRYSETGSAFTYRMIEGAVSNDSLDSSNQLVHVNFPDDTDLSLEWVYQNGRRDRRTNDRRNGVEITDPEAFAEANRSPDHRGQVNPSGVFAKAFNRAAREAWVAHGGQATTLSTRQLEDMLEMGLGGGTKRKLPPEAVINTDLVDLMPLPDPTGDLPQTNLHGMLGLTFRIGGKQDLAQLQDIGDLYLHLDNHDPQNPIPSVHLGASQEAGEFIENFFSNLTGDLPGEQVLAAVRGNFENRVYCQANCMTFGYQGVDGDSWYRRRPEQAVAGRLDDHDQTGEPSLDQLRRVVVHFDRTGNIPFPEQVASLEWQLFRSFESRLERYRQYPSDESKETEQENTIDQWVLRLMPTAEDRIPFFKALGEDPNCFADALFLRQSDSTSVEGLAYLGCFDFPWDRAQADMSRSGIAVLFHGSVSPPLNVSVLVPVRHEGQTVSLTTGLTGNQPGIDPLGLRWEWERGSGSFPTITFDLLKLITDFDLPVRLTPTMAFQGDEAFVFARSLAQMEGVIAADYPEPDNGTGAQTTPENDYLEDLINHNSINLFHDWHDEPTRHLNPAGELYPVFQALEAQRRSLVFHYRYHFQAEKPSEMENAPEDHVRRHFQRMVRLAGENRLLSWNLEHTYGTTLDFTQRDNHATFFPSVPLVPAEVMGRDEGESSVHFLTIDYRRGPDQEVEEAVLTFNRELLEGSLFGDDTFKDLHVAAWRSVAELAAAGSISLRVRCMRFNFRQSIDRSRGASIGAGLRPVPEFDLRTWPLHENLVPIMNQWLDQGTSTDPFDFTVTLTGADEAKLFRHGHALLFELVVERQNALKPDPNRDWHLVRTVHRALTAQELYDQNGQKVMTISDPLTRARFNDWLDKLAKREAVVKPNDSEQDQSTAFRRLIGNQAMAGGDFWIVPPGIPLSEAGEAEPIAMPLGFRPLAQHSWLGSRTQSSLFAYMNALQALIDCRIRKWAVERDASAWRTYFEGLQSSVPAIESLISRLAGLIWPQPSPSDCENAALPTLNLLRDGGELPDTVKQWVHRQLLTEPSQYATAKAYLYTRLASQTTVLPGDFYRLASRKVIEPARNQQPALVDDDLFTFRNSLQTLMDKSTYGFMEVLDDARYDERFHFDRINLDTFEAVIDQVSPEAKVGDRLRIPIKKADDGLERLHLASGSQILESDAEPLPVYLASRRPVKDPVMVHSFYLPEMQRPEGLQPKDRILSLEALSNGTLREAEGGETGLSLVGFVESGVRSNRRDDFMLSVLLGIQGNEEAEQQWTKAFEQDVIRFNISDIHGDGSDQTLEPSAPDPEVQELFKALDRAPEPSTIPDPERLIRADVLELVNGAVVAQGTVVPGIEDLPNVTLEEGVANQTFSLAVDTAAHPRLSQMEAHIFKLTDASAEVGDVSEAMYYLLVSFELPIWDPTLISALQTRNILELDPDHPGRRFDSAFGMISRRISADSAFSHIQAENLEDEPAVEIPRGTYTTSELIKLLLLDTQYLTTDDWTRFDLSITISHWQRLFLPSAHLNEEGTMVETEEGDEGSKRPLLNVQVPAESEDEQARVWFAEAHNAFIVDFMWSSNTNLPFLRLTNVKVNIID